MFLAREVLPNFVDAHVFAGLHVTQDVLDLFHHGDPAHFRVMTARLGRSVLWRDGSLVLVTLLTVGALERRSQIGHRLGRLSCWTSVRQGIDAATATSASATTTSTSTTATTGCTRSIRKGILFSLLLKQLLELVA